MKTRPGITTSLLFVLASLVRSEQTSSSSSKLQIHIPKSLRSNHYGYDHRRALFGNHPPGGSIVQQLYYVDSDLCYRYQTFEKDVYPSRDIDPMSNEMYPLAPPFLLMVRRGGCNFVTKVRNAQHAGAAGVIIADNVCVCRFKEYCIPADAPNLGCEREEPEMSDDGSGQDITIPSFLMFKQDADPIIEALKKDTYVQCEMSWSLPRQTIVDLTFWSTPGEPSMKKLEEQLSVAMIEFHTAIRFTPHFHTFGCRSDGGTQSQCANMCTNGGRYCATDPDGDVDHGSTGANVVEESLRRICIWKLYGGDDGGGGAAWWSYVQWMAANCSEESFYTKECHLTAMQMQADIDQGKVEMCMRNSGGLEGDVTNVWLEEELVAEIDAGVVVRPAAYVNGKLLQGALTIDTVFEAVCAGFTPESKPYACRECAFCPIGTYACLTESFCSVLDDDIFRPSSVWDDDVEWDDDWSWGDRQFQNLSLILTVLSALFVCAFFGAVYCYHKRSRRQVRDQVRGIVNEYMQVDNLTTDESLSSPTAGTYTPATYIPFDYEKFEATQNNPPS